MSRIPNWILALYVTLGVLAAAMLAIGLSGGLDGEGRDATFIAAGLLGLIVIGATVPLVLLHVDGPDRRGKRRVPVSFTSTAEGNRLLFIEQMLAEIRDLAVLTDDAKRVLFRNRERTILSALVDQALAAHHFAAAESLCDAIEDDLGYDELATECRARIERVRAEDTQGQAAAAMEVFEACLARLDWGGAYQEAAQIRTISSDPQTASHLEERTRQAREEHKHHLEATFREAAAREDVDGALSILKEIDRYMTRDEAERLRHDAEAIIQRHREQLGVSFQLAVQEKRWADAARAGNVIIEEYPNTKMAEEVRSMIDVLRNRATQSAVAAETGG